LGQNLAPIGAQDATRISMIDNFDVELPYIMRDIDNDVLSSLPGRITGWFNQGRAGAINRQISEANDLISRFLTGAGKNLTEVTEFLDRYQPNPAIDTKDTMKSKVHQLSVTLQGIKSGVTTRDFDAWKRQRVAERAAQETAGGGTTPAPGGGGGDNPAPLTRQQRAQEELRKRGLLPPAGGQ